MLPDEIADSASNEDVRGKVLFAGDTRGADGRSAPVCQQFGEPSGVFMRQNGGESEGQSSVSRREGVVACALKEAASAVDFERTLTLERILEHLINGQRVHHRFSAENARFALLAVSGIPAQQIKPG